MTTEPSTYRRTGACGVLTLPAPGARNRKLLCFDTGEMVADPKIVMRRLPNGEYEMCPAPDAVPSAHGTQLFDSALNAILRVLNEHAKSESDTLVSIIGSIVSVVVQFAGPRPGVERMSRLFIYVAMLPAHYEKTLRAKHFSYVATLNDTARRPAEISPTPHPYFKTTRIYPVEWENMAMHFFSEKGLRTEPASQSCKMSTPAGDNAAAPVGDDTAVPTGDETATLPVAADAPPVIEPAAEPVVEAVPDGAPAAASVPDHPPAADPEPDAALATIGNLGKEPSSRMSTYSELLDTASAAERERIAASDKLADAERRFASAVRANIELRRLAARLYLQKIERDLLNPEATARLNSVLAALDVDADIELMRLSELLTALSDLAQLSDAEMRAAAAARGPMSRYSQYRETQPGTQPQQSGGKRARFEEGVSIY